MPGDVVMIGAELRFRDQTEVPMVKIARMTVTGQWPPTRRPEWPRFGPVRASAGTSVHAQRG